jgi:hypothetical protein
MNTVWDSSQFSGEFMCRKEKIQLLMSIGDLSGYGCMHLYVLKLEKLLVDSALCEYGTV